MQPEGRGQPDSRPAPGRRCPLLPYAGRRSLSYAVVMPRLASVLLLAAAPACAPIVPAESQTPARVVRMPAPPTAVPAAAVEAPADDASPEIHPLDLAGLHPGMHVGLLRAILGEEDHVETFEDARASWSAQGYHLDSQIEFLVGFDTILSFNDASPKVDPPVWNVYVRDSIVTLLKFTRYVQGKRPVGEYGFPPSCFLDGDPSGIARTFGAGGLVIPDAEHHSESHHYLERGITIVVKENVIAVFDLYEPMSGDRLHSVTAALSRRRAPGRRS